MERRIGRVKRLALTSVLVILLALPAGGVAAAKGRVCGFLHASVPYSRHGSRDRWRVYVAGDASCAAAEQALDAVMHLRARLHQGKDEASTYSTYRSWSCPAGDMGIQNCLEPHRSPPYSAQTVAVDCRINPHECPSTRPPSWFPN